MGPIVGSMVDSSLDPVKLSYTRASNHSAGFRISVTSRKERESELFANIGEVLKLKTQFH